jgi:hypothetical protein
VQQNKGLQAGDGDAKVGFDGQSSLEELVMGRPIRHEFFCQGRAKVAVCLRLGMSEFVEFAEGSESKYQVDAGEVTRIIDGGCSIVQIVENLVKVLPEIDRTMKVETGEVDVDDVFCKYAVLGQPDVDLGRF